MTRLQSSSESEPSRLKSVTQWLWIAMALVGIAFLGAGALQSQRMLACRGWPTVEGVVQVSEVARGPMREGNLKFRYHIVYRYTVRGRSYESERLSFSRRNDADHSPQKLAAAYLPGSRVTVHYNPSRPGLAVLETDLSWQGFRRLIAGLILACLGAIGFWRRWPMQTDYLFRERDPDQPMTFKGVLLGIIGLSTCLGIFWLWWELIKMYAGR